MEKLTIQEEEIMRHIWRLGDCCIKEIVERLPEPKLPYTTVASVVTNLKRKQYVSTTRVGNTYRYAPLVAESEYKRSFLTGFVHHYFQNSFKEMVSFFAKEQKISADELKDIINMIEQGKKED